jgi:hypothetical protein
MFDRVKRIWKKQSDEPIQAKPSFTLPIGLRINGVIKFNASFDTYFLLNTGKLQTVPCGNEEVVIQSVSKSTIFGLDIYRAYFDAPTKSLLQVNTEREKVNDVIFFNRAFCFEVIYNSKDYNNWLDMIGFKDIKTPDGIEFFRDWMSDIETDGEYVQPIKYSERIFSSETMSESWITHESMLYSRIIPDGTEEDIEYLLTSIIKNEDPRGSYSRYFVEIWPGIVVNKTQFELF